MTTQRAAEAAKKLFSMDRGKAFEAGVRAALGLLLANARCFTSFAPFGIAMAAAAPAGFPGIAGAVGAMLGYLIGNDILASLRYVFSILLIRAVLHLFRNTELAERQLFPLGVTLVSVLSFGFVYAWDGGWQPVELAFIAAEGVTAAAMCFFYTVALSPWNEASGGSFGRVSHTISVAFLVCGLCMALAGVSVFGVLSLGQVLALMAVMLASYKGGTGFGAAAGAAFGAAIDLSLGTVGVFAAAYAISALISGIFARSGKLIYLLSFIAAHALGVIWGFSVTGSVTPLYASFAASVIFMLIPDTALGMLGSLIPVRASGYGYIRAREYARRRLKMCAEGFRVLVDTVNKEYGEGAASDDPAKIFDAAAEAVCRSCPDNNRCWQRNYQDTCDIMNNLTPKLRDEGKITADDLPERFTDACGRVARLVEAINSETRSRRMIRQFDTRLDRSRRAAVNQYSDARELMSTLSGEFGEDVRVEPQLEKRVIKHLALRGIDASAAVMRVKGGRLRVELTGEALPSLTREDGWLTSLSYLLDTPLRVSEGPEEPGRLVLLERATYTPSLSAAKSGKGGGISGDRCLSFTTDEGLFTVILADGMGSGEEAARISSALLSALERFMKAGLAPELCLSLVDNMMLVKNESDTDSSTVDMLTVDIYTGEARSYKLGAAPSYIRHGDGVRRITQGLFPAGLGSPEARREAGRRFRAADGDDIVLVSDGIVSGSDDRWLRELIREKGGSGTKELARGIMESAISRTGGEDDMTVLCVSIG